MIGDILFLIITGIAFSAIGAGAWRIATGRFPHQDEWLGIALPLGLGLGGTIVGIAASTVSFLAGFWLIAILAIVSTLWVGSNRALRLEAFAVRSWFASRAGLSISALIVVLIVPGLFVPVIDGDALCYHLEVAKRMVQDDRVQFDPDLHETAYPLLVESLQAVALKCRGPVATRAISFWFGIALAFASVSLAGTLVKGQARYLAAALVLITPVVHCGTISPLNDVALASFCTSALAAWFATESTAFATWRRYAICGTFCGLACGVKFPGIVWLVVMTSYLIVESILRIRESGSIRNQRTVRHIAVFSAFVLIAGSFWYARAAVLTGNPVHPYFRNTFGGHGLDEVLEDARKSPLEHIVNIATAPVVMALSPSRFDSFSHQSGPLFLALIPLGLLRKSSTRWKTLVALGWLLMAICLTQRQSPRFFVATFALWSAAAAATMSEWYRNATWAQSNSRKLAGISLGCICLMAASLGAFDLARVKTGALILASQVSPHDWLESNEPTAKLRAWTALNLPPDARLIGQDHRGYYWPRRFTMEKAHRRRTGLLNEAKSPDEVISRLRSAGFSHLVMAEPDPVDAVEFDIDLSERLAPWLARTQPMIDVTLPEIDGYVRRYRIFEIGAAGESSQESTSEVTISSPSMQVSNR
jgi:hypothetical protein